MKKVLKSGYRFNAQLRTKLADKIAEARNAEQFQASEKAREHIKTVLLDAYWLTSDMNKTSGYAPPSYDRGEFPMVAILTVQVDGVTHNIELADKVALPFRVYMSQYDAYKAEVDGTGKGLVDLFINDLTNLQIKLRESKATLENFLKEFTSPAKLLEVAPDFEAYFPAHYYDEVEDAKPATSIDLLLGETAEEAKPAEADAETAEIEADAVARKAKAKAKKQRQVPDNVAP